MTNIIGNCQANIERKKVRELSSLIGKLTDCILPVVPAPLHYRHLQMQHTIGLLKNQNYEAEVALNGKEQRGNRMVDKVSEVNQWQMYIDETDESGDNERCVRQRMGSLVRFSTDNGFLDREGEELAHICQRAHGDKVVYES